MTPVRSSSPARALRLAGTAGWLLAILAFLATGPAAQAVERGQPTRIEVHGLRAYQSMVG